MTSILIQELAHYNTSKDYEWLAKELKKHAIMCIIDYRFTADGTEYIFRDVGQTVYFEKNGHGTWQISSRGNGYLTAFNEKEFIALCEILHVEFIKP